ncbi:hypothetical protein RN001_006061 [Aquatica leii]|uniref:MADF domain-containing protein n=1 Tax=Aquatica leii TaxID=1421715 RepID=A0AAN7Q266_9COLE|nr:hypothetical protein RN001_006061 [Aquatica leii]
MASRNRNPILEQFVEIYKSEPCFGRVKSKEYHDRDKRSQAYGKLIIKLKKLERRKDDVISKINTLRSNVKREKKNTVNLKSGASSDDIYKSTLRSMPFFLGRSIAMKLRSLDKRQRLIAKNIIDYNLFDAEMGNLNTEAILKRQSFTFVSSPTPSLSGTPSPSPSLSLVQKY